MLDFLLLVSYSSAVSVRGTSAQETQAIHPLPQVGAYQYLWLKVPYLSSSGSDRFVNFQRRFFCTQIMLLTRSKQLVAPLDSPRTVILT